MGANGIFNPMSPGGFMPQPTMGPGFPGGPQQTPWMPQAALAGPPGYGMPNQGFQNPGFAPQPGFQMPGGFQQPDFMNPYGPAQPQGFPGQGFQFPTSSQPTDSFSPSAKAPAPQPDFSNPHPSPHGPAEQKGGGPEEMMNDEALNALIRQLTGGGAPGGPGGPGNMDPMMSLLGAPQAAKGGGIAPGQKSGALVQQADGSVWDLETSKSKSSIFSIKSLVIGVGLAAVAALGWKYLPNIRATLKI